MIPNGVIEDIKYRNPIEDVVSSYVTLKRSGANLKGLCPFHSERSPSFTVYTGSDSHFFCYGCGAGGDVISFIMRIENLDYVGALQFLAARCGITLPDDDSPVQKGTGRSRILEINLMAAKFFREMLFSPTGAPGMAYFSGKRGLSGAVIRRFGLGYAPGSFNALRDRLRIQGCTDEELIDANLCQRSRKNEKTVYDTFRNRVMFPIIDVSGNVVAFGGRVLDDSKPKYLNSAETAAFKKSRNLFALNYAKNHTEDGLVLCEGYMDVIAMHAAGFENAVATLGTAITPDHARIMKKYTDKVVISYDSDEAGRSAAEKALRILADVGIDAKVLRIPDAKDPDEYIKTHGRESFARVLKGSKSKFDYRIDVALSSFDITDADQKAKAARQLCGDIAATSSRVERDIFVEKAAKALSVDPKSIKHDVEVIIRKKAYKDKKEQHMNSVRETLRSGDRVNPDFSKNLRAGKLEEMVLGMMMLDCEYIDKVKNGGLLSISDFTTPFAARLFEKLTEYGSDGFDMGLLSRDFSQDEVSAAVKMTESRRRLSDNGTEVFCDAVQKLKDESALVHGRDRPANNDNLQNLVLRRRADSDLRKKHDQ